MKRQNEIGQYLAVLRERAGLKQNELARRIEWSAAVLSRVEGGERSLTDDELESVLKGIGTPEAFKVKDALGRQWDIIPEPPLADPDADLLWQAEQAAQEVHALAESPDVKQFFERRLVRYKEELSAAAGLVADKRYRVAFLGPIAVGKSTAICRAEGLELPTPKGMPKAVLETGAGGITICEVHLRQGPEYGLIIEPCAEDEIRRHVMDFANFLLNAGNVPSASDDGGEGGSSGISREVERAIRSMASLRKRRAEKKPDGTIVPASDDARKLAEEFPDPKALCVELLARMELHKRDRRVAWYTDTMGGLPLAWLQETFELVNNGRHPEFTLPKRIELVLPTSILAEEALSVTLIDTQGIDDVAERADLEQHFDDPHTVVVLCTLFNEAPSTQIRQLLTRAKEGGVRNLESHTGVLILPRPGDALKVKDNGYLVETAEEGCVVKGEEVQLRLHPLGLKELAIQFFNSAEDAPDVLRSFIRSRIEAVREHHRSAVREIIAGARALLANYEREQSREIMRAAARRLDVWLVNNTALAATPSRHVQDSLIAAVAKAHPRTIFASVTRTGEWPNLDYPHQLSHGARRIATQMIEPKLTGLKVVADNLLQDEEMGDASDLISQCVRVMEDSFDKLVRKVQLVGQSIYAHELRPDISFWQSCENESGRGYRDRINGHNRAWFSDKQHGSGDTRVVELVREAWGEVIQSVRDLIVQE